MALSRFSGLYNAADFAYGINKTAPALQVISGPNAAGAGSLTLAFGTFNLADGTSVSPLATTAPIIVGGDSAMETQTPSGVSTSTPLVYGSTTVTYTNWTYVHGNGDSVRSGTVGLQEALNFCALKGGGIVMLDAAWYAMGGTAAILAAATVPATVTIWDIHNGDLSSFNVTTSAAAPVVTHGLDASVTANYAGSMTPASNLIGVRGEAHIATGTTLAGNYVYGTQGKLFVAGTMAGSAWAAGLVGQTDISAATLTSGSHITPIWSDAGATGPSVSCTFADSLVLTNTTATTFNSLIYGYSKAAFAFDLSDNGGGYIVATAAASGWSKSLKVKINGATFYIPLNSSAS